jgi:hypothetical protein
MSTNQLLGIAGLFAMTFIFQTSAIAQESPGQYIPPQDYQQPAVVAPPDWAPPYDSPAGVQYYYIPDIECYYDVWHHEFVYMENGNWIFSPILPPMYAGYDLMHGHIVILDRHVHQPWMHHELYMTHYPRYYHHETYPAREGYSRPYGYDENAGKPIYVPNHDAGRHEAPRGSNDRTQPIHYRDKNVGRPVPVGKDMRRPSDHR